MGWNHRPDCTWLTSHRNHGLFLNRCMSPVSRVELQLLGKQVKENRHTHNISSHFHIVFVDLHRYNTVLCKGVCYTVSKFLMISTCFMISV